MASEKKFSLLRNILRAIGLSRESANEVVDKVTDLLSIDNSNGAVAEEKPLKEFPYTLRDHFVTPAELKFYDVLCNVVGDKATICTKVGLGDIFWVKSDDYAYHRTYTNKIDRKHVDFLLCNAKTMQPLMGIELDDKSHQRADRRERDAFVDEVFHAAKLPLLHVPVKASYKVDELARQIASHLSVSPAIQVSSPKPTISAPQPVVQTSPVCPKCGSEMILRTTKKGERAGQQFYGCSNYPSCRAMIPI